MSAYYNEIDPQKAAWLRELIKAGHIAPGEVDERSIAVVRPDDLRGYAQCHFFAGIGIWSYALRLAGWPDEREVWTGSCPCQPFSDAGKKAAFDDPRHLWSDFFRLIAARRPLVCLGEQVASADGLAWFDAVCSDLDNEGYSCGAVDMCAAGFGAPHRRQRLYWVADAGSRGCKESGDGGIDQSRVRNGEPAGSRLPRELADNSGDGRREKRPHDGRGRPRNGAEGARSGSGASGVAGGLADAASERYDGRWLGGALWEPGAVEQPERLRDAGGLADAGCAELEARIRGMDSERRENGATCAAAQPHGATRGFWGSAGWVLTRPQRVGDSPGLRPVEPGTFPLVNGASARVGRVRGYGDGIVAPQAAVFVKAYMELRR